MTEQDEKTYLLGLADGIIKNAFKNEKWRAMPSDLKHDIVIFAVFVKDFLKRSKNENK